MHWKGQIHSHYLHREKCVSMQLYPSTDSNEWVLCVSTDVENGTSSTGQAEGVHNTNISFNTHHHFDNFKPTGSLCNSTYGKKSYYGFTMIKSWFIRGTEFDVSFISCIRIQQIFHFSILPTLWQKSSCSGKGWERKGKIQFKAGQLKSNLCSSMTQ